MSEKKHKTLVVKREGGEDQILSVSIMMGDTFDSRGLSKDLEINDLEEDCMMQPHLFAWWGVVSATAKKAADIAKERLDVTEAEINMTIRREKAQSNEKVTEAQLENLVKESDEYLEAVKEKIRATYESDMLRVAAEAFNHKKDMLVTLAAIKRQEMASGITMSDANNQIKKGVSKKIDNAGKK